MSINNKRSHIRSIVKVNNEIFSKEDFEKDCPNYKFNPTILPAKKRVIAIGDIHGDLDLAIRSFKLANLIDDDHNWIANPVDTVVVQVGDQIDSCRPIPDVYDCHFERKDGDSPDDMKVIDFFNKMDKKARAKGGAVYSLLGNHEIMNSEGRFEYVSYDNFYDFEYKDKNETFNGPAGRKSAFKPGAPVAKMLACSRSSVMVIGSNMFIHAGVLPVLARRLEHLNLPERDKLKYLNAIVRKWLLNKLSTVEEHDSKSLFIDDMKLSPFWTRVFGKIPKNTNLNSDECFDTVQKVIEVFKIGQIIVGHTPTLYTHNDGINGTCYETDGHNRLFRVDGGFSKSFSVFGNNNLVQVLEIIDDNQFNILKDTKLADFVKKPDIDINEEEMKKVAAIAAQNRVKTPKMPKKSKSKKVYF
jgi:hypothetical protein